MVAKETNQAATSISGHEEKASARMGLDWIRVILGIIILSVLLGASLSMINGKFAEKQAELVEDSKKDFGWVVITVGYTLPLIFACAVPVAMCVGSKRDAQRKHLIKGLIIAGAFVIIFGVVCPKHISDTVKQWEFCKRLEQRVEDEEDFVYPKDQPKVDEVTTEMGRAVKWTAKAALGLAVVGAYQGARYKKLRDGDLDDEIPEDELSDDDLPDVDWIAGKGESKNS